jgi:hypothetical protein
MKGVGAQSLAYINLAHDPSHNELFMAHAAWHPPTGKTKNVLNPQRLADGF